MFSPSKSYGIFWVAISMLLASLPAVAAAPKPAQPDKELGQYRQLLENFAGWAEQHWNEKEQCYDAAGAGVTWSRGNGDVCIVYAVLLTELPKRPVISPRIIPREIMFDHVRRTLRTLCLRNRNCTDPQAVKPSTWGGPSWQAALETENWVFAANLLADQLDEPTKALVRQVASAEAEAAKKTIPSVTLGDTKADDCSWNAGLLGVVAAFYHDDQRAASWDEWAKRWALNMEARERDRTSQRVVDGKPLGEWLVSTNAYPDLTMENHDFWDLPYQVCFAELVQPALAYHLCGMKIPEAFHFNAKEQSDYILRWATLIDGDLLCPQGLDWADRDVQHSWAFAELGTLLDLPWARVAEDRCLQLLTQRQTAFGDGALHALDFGYETDLARMWSHSYLLHKYFGKARGSKKFDEPKGGKVYPYVATALYRSPNLVSSVSWHRRRQAVMIVLNNAKALGDYPSFAGYKSNPERHQISGLGYIQLEGNPELKPFHVDGDARIEQAGQTLAVSFSRTIPGVATQRVGYCALPTRQVIVFSQWRAVEDIKVARLVDHPFYWIEIPGYLPTRTAKAGGNGVWSIDGKLQMQVLGGAGGKVEKTGVLGSVRDTPWTAKAGEVLQDSACVYQAEVPGHAPVLATGGANRVVVGDWVVERVEDGHLSITKSSGKK